MCNISVSGVPKDAENSKDIDAQEIYGKTTKISVRWLITILKDFLILVIIYLFTLSDMHPEDDIMREEISKRAEQKEDISMSYDLKIWSSKQLQENNPILLASGFIYENGGYVRKGNGWLVNVSIPFTVEPEDIPESIMQTLVGISYMIEINIEPISAPDKVKNETLKLCKSLATEIKGVVEDPQEDAIVIPGGIKKNIYDKPKDKDQPQISLIWYFEDMGFHKSNKIGRLIDLFERYMPYALPRRYGEYEPPQYRYAETGKAHLIDFLKSESSPVYYASKPFSYLFMDVPNPESEIEVYIKNGLYKKHINPQSFYGKIQSRYRCGKIELQMLKEVFLQPDWNLAVKRLFIEAAKILYPFYAEIIEEKPHKNIWGMSIPRTWWWRGIPKDLGCAAVIDERYLQQWNRFQQKATEIAPTLYIVDCFGESEFSSISKKVGAVPHRIAAPMIVSSNARFFPFSVSSSFLRPPLDKTAVDVIWSDNGLKYAEILKHHSGDVYHFRCMKLDYDIYEDERIYYWIPIHSQISSFYDTPEKAVVEARKVLI